VSAVDYGIWSSPGLDAQGRLPLATAESPVLLFRASDGRYRPGVNASAWVAIVAIAAGAITSVSVAHLTFRHARQLDKERRLATQRDEFYIDLLIEANAERVWAEQLVLSRRQGVAAESPPDTRLPAADRARLAARVNVFAEPDVVSAWVDFDNLTSGFVHRPADDGTLIEMQASLDDAVSQLGQAIQRATTR